MKDRLIDTSLLVVLILVALAIFWTLLNSFGIGSGIFQGRNTPPAERQLVTQSATPTPTTNIIEVTPNDTQIAESAPPAESNDLEQYATNVDGNVLVIDPNNTTSNSVTTPQSNGTTGENSNEALASDNPVTQETHSVIAVPEGSIELERIGFSSVTGGVGACNVVLEPWKHIAVSRDIRETYPCGSELTVRLETPIDGRNSFTGIVADTMNPSKVKTVNVYVETQELALEYGINDGLLEP